MHWTTCRRDSMSICAAWRANYRCCRVEPWALRDMSKLSSHTRQRLTGAKQTPLRRDRSRIAPWRCFQKRPCTALNGRETFLGRLSSWSLKPSRRFLRAGRNSSQVHRTSRCLETVWRCCKEDHPTSTTQYSWPPANSSSCSVMTSSNCFTCIPLTQRRKMGSLFGNCRRDLRLPLRISTHTTSFMRVSSRLMQYYCVGCTKFQSQQTLERAPRD